MRRAAGEENAGKQPGQQGTLTAAVAPPAQCGAGRGPPGGCRPCRPPHHPGRVPHLARWCSHSATCGLHHAKLWPAELLHLAAGRPCEPIRACRPVQFFLHSLPGDSTPPQAQKGGHPRGQEVFDPEGQARGSSPCAMRRAGASLPSQHTRPPAPLPRPPTADISGSGAQPRQPAACQPPHGSRITTWSGSKGRRSQRSISI